MLTSFSSLRLDDYVYTHESLREARGLLAPGGTLTLAFSGVHFVHQRLYAMLTQTFDDVPPHVYFTRYDGAGLVFVSGAARARPPIPGVEEAGDRLAAPGVRPSTDRWPFLYLETPHVPVPMLLVLLLMILGARRLVKAAGLTAPVLGDRRVLQFLLLGAGFLLLQTKGITEVSLLFGSTWMTTAVVIAGFLLMALLANMAVALRPWPIALSYIGLFAALLINAAVPYTAVAWLPFAAKILAAACLVGLPVFFSGLVFSTLFRTMSVPAVALGANLLGATIGGALETLVMVGGTPILALLSIALYAASAYTTSRTQNETVPVPATASAHSA